MSKLMEKGAEPLNAAAQLSKLRDWLQQEVGMSLPLKRRSVNLSQVSGGHRDQLLALNEQERVYCEVLEKMDEIESGSRQPDPLGADEMPGVLDTAELEDM